MNQTELKDWLEFHAWDNKTSEQHTYLSELTTIFTVLKHLPTDVPNFEWHTSVLKNLADKIREEYERE